MPKHGQVLNLLMIKNDKTTVNSQLKKGWVVKSLGEIAQFLNGKAHEQFIENDAQFIVINSKFVSTQGRVYKTSSVNLCPLKKGDIAMVMSDIPNGKALAKCFLVPKDDRYALNQRICSLRAESVNNVFLSLILNRNKYYLAFDSGTGQTNLKRRDKKARQSSATRDTKPHRTKQAAACDFCQCYDYAIVLAGG